MHTAPLVDRILFARNSSKWSNLYVRVRYVQVPTLLASKYYIAPHLLHMITFTICLGNSLRLCIVQLCYLPFATHC